MVCGCLLVVAHRIVQCLFGGEQRQQKAHLLHTAFVDAFLAYKVDFEGPFEFIPSRALLDLVQRVGNEGRTPLDLCDDWLRTCIRCTHTVWLAVQTHINQSHTHIDRQCAP